MALFEKNPSAPRGNVVVTVAGGVFVIRDGAQTEVSNKDAIDILLLLQNVRLVGDIGSDFDPYVTPQPIYVAGDPDAGDGPVYDGSKWGFEVSAGGGGAALGVVSHGADADMSRPDGFSTVLWIGSVQPSEASDGDLVAITA